MRVKVKQTEWILPVSHRHLQTPIKQSQHLSVSVLRHVLDCDAANAVQNQLYASLKTNTDIRGEKKKITTSDCIK